MKKLSIFSDLLYVDLLVLILLVNNFDWDVLQHSPEIILDVNHNVGVFFFFFLVTVTVEDFDWDVLQDLREVILDVNHDVGVFFFLVTVVDFDDFAVTWKGTNFAEK